MDNGIITSLRIKSNRVGVDWTHLAQDRASEHRNEHPSSIQCGEFRDWVRNY